MNAISKKPKLVVFIVVTILLNAFAIFGLDYIANARKKQPLFSRVIGQTQNFEHIWTQSNIVLPNDEQSSFLIATDHKLFIYGEIDSLDKQFLQIDLLDGEVISHETPGIFSLPLSFGTIDKIAHDDLFVYFGYTGGKAVPNSMVAAGGIAAYSMNDDRIQWVHKIPGTRSVNSLLVGNGIVSVDSNGNADFYMFDAETGDLLAKRAKDGYADYAANIAFWYGQATNEDDSLINERQSEMLELWKRRFLQVIYPPILLDDIVLVKLITATARGQVQAMDKITGEILWQTESDVDVASNVSVADSRAYYLSATSELAAVDVETGETVGSVQFMNDEIEQDGDRGYFVAASKDLVFVYFGDSRQLFAFRFAE